MKRNLTIIAVILAVAAILVVCINVGKPINNDVENPSVVITPTEVPMDIYLTNTTPYSDSVDDVGGVQ